MNRDCRLTQRLIENIPSLQRPFLALQSAADEYVACLTIRDILHRGLRNIPTLLTNVSTVCRERGMIFRGHELPTLTSRSVLELLWMGVTSESPTPDQLDNLAGELNRYSAPPPGVIQLIESCDHRDEPILIFAQCLLSMASACQFSDNFSSAWNDKTRQIPPALDHVKRIVALSLPLIGLIHRRITGAPRPAPIDWRLGWGANLCRALGVDEAYRDLAELYGVVHIDQGKGNPSSHVSHIVSTTGADPYRCVATSLITLSCPSHAFASLGVLTMLDDLVDRYSAPTNEQIRDYLIEKLARGERLYGIGQTVMKNLDTRFAALRTAAEPLISRDLYYRIVTQILAVVPDAFYAIGNTRITPHPNVNMINPLILCRLMGVDRTMLPLLFASSRIIGNLCQYIENLLIPSGVCRPLSYTAAELMERSTPGTLEHSGTASCPLGEHEVRINGQ